MRCAHKTRFFVKLFIKKFQSPILPYLKALRTFGVNEINIPFIAPKIWINRNVCNVIVCKLTDAIKINLLDLTHSILGFQPALWE